MVSFTLCFRGTVRLVAPCWRCDWSPCFFRGRGMRGWGIRADLASQCVEARRSVDLCRLLLCTGPTTTWPVRLHSLSDLCHTLLTYATPDRPASTRHASMRRAPHRPRSIRYLIESVNARGFRRPPVKRIAFATRFRFSSLVVER